jgi:hypothetical protein
MPMQLGRAELQWSGAAYARIWGRRRSSDGADRRDWKVANAMASSSPIEDTNAIVQEQERTAVRWRAAIGIGKR